MKLKYAVVITTFNRIKLLKECVSMVYSQSYPFSQVIIVNNGSKDGTKEYLDELKDEKENLKVINLKSNTGGAGGFAVGIKYASTTENDYILIIDDDAIISSNYIEKINEYAKLQRYQAYSGTVYTNGKINLLHRYNCKKSGIYSMQPIDATSYSDEVFAYDIGTFCGIVLSTNLINNVGEPRTDFFITYDDTEYCLRITKYTKFLNINAASLNHKEENSSRSYCWKKYYGLRNKIIVYREYSETKLLCNMYFVVIYFYRVLKCIGKLILRNDTDQLMNIKQYIDALVDGCSSKTGVREEYLP